MIQAIIGSVALEASMSATNSILDKVIEGAKTFLRETNPPPVTNVDLSDRKLGGGMGTPALDLLEELQ